jgi:hypothetical protein
VCNAYVFVRNKPVSTVQCARLHGLGVREQKISIVLRDAIIHVRARCSHNRCVYTDKQLVKLQETPDAIPDG